MELLNLLTAIIFGLLAMTSDRFLFSLKLLFSIITGYWLLRFFEPNVYLIEFNEYNWQAFTNTIKEGLFFESLFLISLSYLFFYWLIRFLLHNTIVKYFGKAIENQFAQLTLTERRELRKLVKRLIKKVIEALYNYRIISLEDLDNPTEKHLFEEAVYRNVSIISHSIICWLILKIYLGIPFYVLLAFIITVIIVSIIAVSVTDQLSFVFKDMNAAAAKKKSIVTNESNRNKKQVSR